MIDELAEKVINLLHEDDRQYLKETCKDDLILLHHTLGRHIRNQFGLWELKWTPVIVDGIDVSEDHPDAISMKIIERTWEILKES